MARAASRSREREARMRVRAAQHDGGKAVSGAIIVRIAAAAGQKAAGPRRGGEAGRFRTWQRSSMISGSRMGGW